ncbi:rhamnogalacturonan acetylesterase [Marinigracilibium pacificum]|uniref:Rhamnogalacturonan acetylesterase n=1 Tax=Marinigracilibium pacificum TaxID=2729599 RepID=A0A848IYV0_9BACT|nr:rhamnogalacturonan acetylesterase [Marinigracilibium pacificum]NMM49703.1 rhamnogalacturonan acetylesterase [Marinigracilibium pacificum]
MKGKLIRQINLILLGLIFASYSLQEEETTIFLIGDSTMTDYSDNYNPGKSYMESRYPMTGWGQVFEPFMVKDSIKLLSNLINGNQVKIENRARGGRSTRTFFQEARWRKVYESLKANDIVIMQFGHNDAATHKTERYVNIEGYKEFLRLYISQTLEKKALPIVLTPVCRNYPWENGYLTNVHGDYPDAAKEVADEFGVPLIDLNRVSMDFFSKKGRDFVTENYFMNIPEGKYEAYPDGLSDDTHFQPEGAKAVAQLVFTELKKLNNSILPK